jgi:hypothetical protein
MVHTPQTAQPGDQEAAEDTAVSVGQALLDKEVMAGLALLA